jgi:hypothetical protein
MMHEDMIEEVGSVGEWLNAWNTQVYLQYKWGFKLTASTASFFSITAYPNGKIDGGSETGQSHLLPTPYTWVSENCE